MSYVKKCENCAYLESDPEAGLLCEKTGNNTTTEDLCAEFDYSECALSNMEDIFEDEE